MSAPATIIARPASPAIIVQSGPTPRVTIAPQGGGAIAVTPTGAPGRRGPAASQDFALPCVGAYRPGEVIPFDIGAMSLDPARCTCFALHGGSAALVWTMTVNDTPFATFTIPTGVEPQGVIAFIGDPTIPDGARVRIVAPSAADPAFDTFSVTLRSA